MKSLIALWKQLAEELAGWCGTSTDRDLKTVTVRSEHEGESFLTITLPSFGKDFQKSLDQEAVGPTSFPGFRRRGGLPLFLGGFLDRVFDRESGRLLDDPDIDSIFAIRQLTLMFEKMYSPCSDVRRMRAYIGYIKCEQEMKRRDAQLSRTDTLDFSRIAQLLYGDVLDQLERDIFEMNLTPQHGPGSTADGLQGNLKFTVRTWTERLQEVFPAEEFLIPSPHFREVLDDVSYLEPGDEIPVKVISVPKTLKTPRIIAMEPTAMQYCQQAVSVRLVELLESNNHTPGMLGFSDQEPNQFMARLGSISGSLATLDLSEASDRVSNQHVRLLLGKRKWCNAAFDACRSRKADVPGFGVIRLSKFASMGSALTFPVEAMVFLTIIFLGIERELNRPITRKDVLSLRGRVRVYGDDIIIPVDYVQSVSKLLTDFGHVVNEGKSFWTGKFRESCGKEFHAGEDVSIVRVRREFPSTRRDVEQVVSLVSLRNQCYMLGLWDTTRYLDGRIRKVLKHFPDVLPSSPALGRVTSLGYLPERDDPILHRPLVKGYVVSADPPVSVIDGYAALMKCFLHKGDQPIADREHLARSGRARSVHIKPRWVTPF